MLLFVYIYIYIYIKKKQKSKKNLENVVLNAKVVNRYSPSK